VPGLGESATKVYEDDGVTQAYDTEYTVTDITKTTTENQVSVKVAPRKGSFKGMLPERRVCVVLEGFYAPSKVTVNGVEIPYARFAAYEQKDGKQVWGYDGSQLQTNIWIEKTAADKELEVVISYEGYESIVVPPGSKGLINRFTVMAPETKLNFFALKIRDFHLPTEFMSVAQCGSYITEKPFEAPSFIKAMDTKAMVNNINSWENLSPEFKAKIEAQTAFKK
jgi:alpha-glucosidase